MFDVWGGISGCQNNVDLMFDEAVKKRGISVCEFVKMIATKPAEIFKLRSKGSIKVSNDADIILLDPNKSYTVKSENLYYRHQHSPYIGRKINCRVTKTLVRGQLVFDLEKGITSEPIGHFISAKGSFIEA